MKISVYFLACIIAVSTLSCKDKSKTVKPDGSLDWYAIEEAGNLKNKEQKLYMIDVYTDWCGWCKVMDRETFSNPEVIAYLNQNFHAVKFDAEQKTAIKFNGKTYNWQDIGRNGINELAMELLGGQLSYPSIVYLDKDRNPITVTKGFKNPEQFLEELRRIKG